MIKIKEISFKLNNFEYLKDRDIFWDKKKEEHCKKSIPLWNGIVYFLEKIEKDICSIYVGEYKDVVFNGEYGIDNIKSKYNLDNNFIYINVQILITKHDTYLFGTKKNVEIIPVGGTLRLEDNKKIENFNDIKEYALKEIDIETKIKLQCDELKFEGLVINHGICTFVFKYELAKNIDSNLLEKGEFEGEIFLPKSEIFNSIQYIPSDRLLSIKEFLIKKWQNN